MLDVRFARRKAAWLRPNIKQALTKDGLLKAA